MGDLVNGFRERNSNSVFDEIKKLYHIIGAQLQKFE